MRTIIRSAVVAIFALFVTSTVVAQDWTKAQNEVWQVVENSWAKWKAGDVDAFTGLLHEKYQGWSESEPLPMSKNAVIKWYNDWKKVMVIDSYTLNPARILVLDDAAVVDYYFTFSSTITTGEKKVTKSGTGKNAEFYVKENGKWMLLGDMTVHLENDDAEDDEEDDD